MHETGYQPINHHCLPILPGQLPTDLSLPVGNLLHSIIYNAFFVCVYIIIDLIHIDLTKKGQKLLSINESGGN